jgi:hypothetical protein
MGPPAYEPPELWAFLDASYGSGPLTVAKLLPRQESLAAREPGLLGHCRIPWR